MRPPGAAERGIDAREERAALPAGVRARYDGAGLCRSGDPAGPDTGRGRVQANGEAPISWKILLAEDHAVVRQGLRAMLEVEGHEVVAEAGDGEEAARRALESPPDVAILDLEMPILGGIEAGRAIRDACPEVRLVALTAHSEERYVLEALEAGFRGYVMKSQTIAQLLRALDEVMRGAVFLGPGASEVVVDGYLGRAQPPKDPLTPREREVLRFVAEGRTTKEVARLLGISAKTAESHRTRIMTKLEIHETAGLVRYAIRMGLIKA